MPLKLLRFVMYFLYAMFILSIYFSLTNTKYECVAMILQKMLTFFQFNHDDLSKHKNISKCIYLHFTIIQGEILYQNQMKYNNSLSFLSIN